MLNPNQIEKHKNLICKYCQSSHVIKYGTYKTKQRYFCCDCNRKFASGNTIPKMQNTIKDIAYVLNMYYEGISKNEIRKNLIKQYGKNISNTSIYCWQKRFTELAKNEEKKHHPKVGDTWIADETFIYFDNRRYWLIDVVDDETGYLLASSLLSNRCKKNIQTCMEQAINKAAKKPSYIITDQWKGYQDGIELACGAETKHIAMHFNKRIPSANKIQKWHFVLNERTQVVHHLKSTETAKDFLDGWLIHYNYFRSFSYLNSITPAEKAGIKFPFRNWEDFIEQPYKITARIPVKC